MDVYRPTLGVTTVKIKATQGASQIHLTIWGHDALKCIGLKPIFKTFSESHSNTTSRNYPSAACFSAACGALCSSSLRPIPPPTLDMQWCHFSPGIQSGTILWERNIVIWRHARMFYVKYFSKTHLPMSFAEIFEANIWSKVYIYRPVTVELYIYFDCYLFMR